MILVIVKEQIGKWFVIVWLTMWFAIQFICHEWYTIFNKGFMGTLERKIEYFKEQGICPHCYKEALEAKKAEGCDEVEMKYSEYKNNYADCDTKSDSYDKKSKTIIVYVPKKESAEEIIEEAEELIEQFESAHENILNVVKPIHQTILANMKKTNSIDIVSDFKEWQGEKGSVDERYKKFIMCINMLEKNHDRNYRGLK